jgi:hypothetical protein
VVALTGLLAFPPVEPLAPLTIQSKLLEVQLRRAPASTTASIDRICAVVSDPRWTAGESCPGLRDELEPYFLDRGPVDGSGAIGKVRVEFAAYCRLAGGFPAFSDMENAEFIRLLRDLHRRLGTGHNALRNGPVGIRPDAAGNTVIFPDHRRCAALLAALHEFLRRHAATHPALCATIAYAAIVHAHPFNDGNGRTARTLYNLVVANGPAKRHFVPIELIAAAHRGSFLIKLKRALYGGDWIGLQAFFTDAFHLSSRLQMTPKADKHTSAAAP